MPMSKDLKIDPTKETEIGVIDAGALWNLFDAMASLPDYMRSSILPQLMFLRDRIRKAEALLTDEQIEELNK